MPPCEEKKCGQLAILWQSLAILWQAWQSFGSSSAVIWQPTGCSLASRHFGTRLALVWPSVKVCWLFGSRSAIVWRPFGSLLAVFWQSAVAWQAMAVIREPLAVLWHKWQCDDAANLFLSAIIKRLCISSFWRSRHNVCWVKSWSASGSRSLASGKATHCQSSWSQTASPSRRA